MKVLSAFVAILVAVTAQQIQEHEPQDIIAIYPEWYAVEQSSRHRRDVNVDKNIGDGRVFGTLGQNDNGLFGKAGYERNIFNDNRGKLDGQAYGTRVLGPNGASSHYGGALNWKNDHATANLDVSRQVHGPSSINAAAGGRWPVGRNGDITAQGFYDKTSGMRHDYGGKANFNYRW